MIQDLNVEAGGCGGVCVGPSVCPWAGVRPWAGPSDLGLQHLQEEFVHGHLALQFDAVEVLYRLGGRLPEQGQRQQQLARPPRLLVALAQLVVLQRLVQQVLQLLDRLQILDVHGICGHSGVGISGATAERSPGCRGPPSLLSEPSRPSLYRETNPGSERLSCRSEVSEANDRAGVHTQGEICVHGGLFLENHQEVAVKGLNMSSEGFAPEVPEGLWRQSGGTVILHPSLASSVTFSKLFQFSAPHFLICESPHNS